MVLAFCACEYSWMSEYDCLDTGRVFPEELQSCIVEELCQGRARSIGNRISYSRKDYLHHGDDIGQGMCGDAHRHSSLLTDRPFKAQKRPKIEGTPILYRYDRERHCCK